ncbi:hypothetical protein B0H14DRAFT_3423642 [Mycena olivaceomarginata]|nr:hypothetical protein B0H14DRAFT_3423642 [Mycena olivaceomarginata]
MSDIERDRAARKIQAAWRNSRRNESNDFLTTAVRLNDATVHAKLTAAREAADAGHNTPQARWRRAIDFAASLQDGNAMLTENGVQDRAPSKFLETQHWLELVDGTAMGLTVDQGKLPIDPEALDTAAEHYAGTQQGKYWLTREFRKRFTLRGIVDRLLRKTVKRNTWIYVSHFRQFIDVLNERGVDMNKAKISKAEMALWGIEHIKRVQKSKARLVESGKQSVSEALHKVGDVATAPWKREVLEGRRKPPLEEKERNEEKECRQDSTQDTPGPS